MRVLVVSDSHGNITNMITAIEQEEPDLIVHLGDYWGDANEIQWIYPELPMERVPGNCDFVLEAPLERTLELEGHRLTICHGHSRGAKREHRKLICLGEETGAELVLFGHTHQPYCERHGNLRLFNPGSIGYGARTYGVLDLKQECIQGKIKEVFSEEEILCFC